MYKNIKHRRLTCLIGPRSVVVVRVIGGVGQICNGVAPRHVFTFKTIHVAIFAGEDHETVQARLCFAGNVKHDIANIRHIHAR